MSLKDVDWNNILNASYSRDILLVKEPVIELCGSNRILIENHRGIRTFESERILVDVSYGQVEVIGSNFSINAMTENAMLIRGKIERISIIGR